MSSLRVFNELRISSGGAIGEAPTGSTYGVLPLSAPRGSSRERPYRGSLGGLEGSSSGEILEGASSGRYRTFDISK